MSNEVASQILTAHYATSPAGRPHGGLRAARCSRPTEPMPTFDTAAACAALRAYRP